MLCVRHEIPGVKLREQLCSFWGEDGQGKKEVGVGTGKRKERGGWGREQRRRGHGAGRVGEG